MEQVIIFIIVAVLMGLSKGAKKIKESQEESPSPPPDRNLPSAPPVLTEADRRYREIQEEIRRRVAQRQQPPQNTSTTTAPAPQRPRAMPNMGLPPKPAPKPISTYQRNIPAPQPSIPAVQTTIPTPVMAMPLATSASTTEAAATEAAAYALPESISEDSSIKAYTISVPSGKLRALLSSPASARQSFVLREIFDRPLSLRQVSYGGYESWR